MPHDIEKSGRQKTAPKLSRTVSTGRQDRHSIASIASASDDVLAAWAELGGGGEALASRRWVR